MLRRTIQCVDPVMTAFQAPQASPARAHPDQPAVTPDVQTKEDAVPSAQAPTPKTPSQEPRVTTEDMSGWAMGGSD